MTRIGGVVLCGGESLRMGSPKAWLPIGAESMLLRVVRLLSEVVTPVIVVAAVDQDLPVLPDDVTIVRDEEKGRGPLQGLASGLIALQSRVDAVYVSSCDVPLLRPALIRRMIGLIGDRDICVPRVQGREHPLAAVYQTRVLSVVRQLLAEDRGRLTLLFDEARTRFVAAEELIDVDPEFDSFRNVNTPEEYAQVLRDLLAT